MGVRKSSQSRKGSRRKSSSGTASFPLSTVVSSKSELKLSEEFRQINRQLDLKTQEQKTLFELSKEFSQVLDAERLIRLLGYSLMGQVGVHRYFIALKQSGELVVRASRLEEPLSHDVLLRLGGLRSGVMVSDRKSKGEHIVRGALENSGIYAVIPMEIQGETRGVFGVGRKMNGEEYSEADLEFLYALGNLAMISMENARLFHEALEKQKLEDELLIARDIQKQLLPHSLPVLREFTVAASSVSSKQVGGDYYDVIDLGNDRIALAIADVSGKGVPASLLMANLQAAIRALAPLNLPLGVLTCRVNDLICDNTSSERFITFFWGILDLKKKQLCYVNAGHNPPFLFCCDGSVQRLDRAGLILGVLKAEAPYPEGVVFFNPGDLLVCFTDGISEAMNKDDEEFTEARLEAVIEEMLTEPAAIIVERIGEEIRRFSAETEQTDDITLLAVKCNPS